ncbi:hypothetical protein ACT6QH_08685 [Xanthobacter sp. TB0139]|uniref:hypothetical protein n=1 Tax=Xanthobacter sp. TB0139 TaxID=3459178 RepID=UPI0040394F58
MHLSMRGWALILGMAGGIMVNGGVSSPAMAFPAGGVHTLLQDAVAAKTLSAEPVGWVCRQNRCTWDPNFRGRVPSYARSWGPPRNNSCRWERVRDRSGDWRWREVCRRR